MKLLTHFLNTMAQVSPSVMNWRYNELTDSLIYSFRRTEYERDSFPSRLHYHDYYELVFFVEGDVEYICGSSVLHPQWGDLVLIPPHTSHMSVIRGVRTTYIRHVFYLCRDALDSLGCGVLLDFLSLADSGHPLVSPENQARRELLLLLERLDEALGRNSEKGRALGRGLLIEIFYLLNECARNPSPVSEKLPDQVRSIQAYIDSHFDTVSCVSEIADCFYFSREYVSRLFRHYLHTSVADYLTQRRVAQSQALIAAGLPLSEVCFRAGFGSLTAFNRSFKKVTGQTPGQYRKLCLDGLPSPKTKADSLA